MRYIENSSYICPICGHNIEWSANDGKLHFDVYNPQTHEILGTVCQGCYINHTSKDITSKLANKYKQSIEWDEGLVNIK